MPHKEVECSGEAARDMANDNTTVFENGNSVPVFFISVLYFYSKNFSQKRGPNRFIIMVTSDYTIHIPLFHVTDSQYGPLQLGTNVARLEFLEVASQAHAHGTKSHTSHMIIPQCTITIITYSRILNSRENKMI